ncbi:GTP cyclohydrolase 1 feedback regulatory protein [Hyperolius riggenbachi]|uniref:GTP cyclohydrolase 1 feedback regulatory protein n=1 Tax=Hyperolius riggenbachi TaxID=752182 RepID=UPI0035A3D139
MGWQSTCAVRPRSFMERSKTGTFTRVQSSGRGLQEDLGMLWRILRRMGRPSRLRYAAMETDQPSRSIGSVIGCRAEASRACRRSHLDGGGSSGLATGEVTAERREEDLSVMPYILISTQIRMESGPTIVGDENSDPELMTQLGAIKRTVLGNNFAEYFINEPPRVTLNKLEHLGYRVISMTGVGQTLVWCLHKEEAR